MSMFQEARPENMKVAKINFSRAKNNSLEQKFDDDMRGLYHEETNNFMHDKFYDFLKKYIMTEGPSGAIKGTVKDFFNAQAAREFLDNELSTDQKDDATKLFRFLQEMTNKIYELFQTEKDGMIKLFAD